MKKIILLFVLISTTVLALAPEIWDEVKAPPAELQSLVTTSLNLQNAARAWITGAMQEDYSDWGEKAQKSVMVSYGIFNLGNYSYCEWVYWQDRENYDAEKCYAEKMNLYELIHKVYKNGKLRQLSFSWMKPVWVKAIGEMDETRKNTIAEALDVGLDYAVKLRDHPEYLNCEAQYLEELKKTNEEYKFTSYAPDATCTKPSRSENDYDPYRKMEAWVYRRVKNKDMTADKIVDWFSKVKNEIL